MAPKASESHGFDTGVSCSIVAATGHGPWTGPFDNYYVDVGPASATYFQSSDPGGCSGVAIGGGVGLTPVGVGAAQTIYTQVWPRCGPRCGDAMVAKVVTTALFLFAFTLIGSSIVGNILLWRHLRRHGVAVSFLAARTPSVLYRAYWSGAARTPTTDRLVRIHSRTLMIGVIIAVSLSVVLAMTRP